MTPPTAPRTLASYRLELIDEWREVVSPEPPDRTHALESLARTAPETVRRDAYRRGYADAARACADQLEAFIDPERDAALPHEERNRRDPFYVIEQFNDGGQSQGYWNGGSSRSFVSDIDAAMQFCRRVDAQRAIHGWHWRDVKITEHLMMSNDLAPLTPQTREDAMKPRPATEVVGTMNSQGPLVDPVTPREDAQKDSAGLAAAGNDTGSSLTAAASSSMQMSGGHAKPCYCGPLDCQSGRLREGYFCSRQFGYRAAPISDPNFFREPALKVESVDQPLNEASGSVPSAAKETSSTSSPERLTPEVIEARLNFEQAVGEHGRCVDDPRSSAREREARYQVREQAFRLLVKAVQQATQDEIERLKSEAILAHMETEAAEAEIEKLKGDITTHISLAREYRLKLEQAEAQLAQSTHEKTCATCQHLAPNYKNPQTGIIGAYCTRPKVPVRWLDSPGIGDTIPYTEFGCIFHSATHEKDQGEKKDGGTSLTAVDKVSGVVPATQLSHDAPEQASDEWMILSAFDSRFGIDGPERNSDSIGRAAGCDDCAISIKIRTEHREFVRSVLAERSRPKAGCAPVTNERSESCATLPSAAPKSSSSIPPPAPRGDQ